MGFKKFVKGVKGLFRRPKERNRGGDDARAQAASQLIREDVKRQAGAGQVEFTEERRV